MGRIRVVMLLALSACGGADPCIENVVLCDNRCLSVCNHGEWHVQCFPCGAAQHFETAANACEMPALACDAGWPS